MGKMGSLTPQRILVRGVNWLGDAVMSTPALLRLRERFPAAHISLLVPAKLRDLWAGHPAVNEVMTFQPDTGLMASARRLRQGQFDLAVVLPNSPRSALEVWLAGIPRRVGYARAWRNWWLTDVVPTRPGAVTMQKRREAEIIALTMPGAKVPLRPVIPASAHQSWEYLHLMSALGASAEPLAPRLVVRAEEVAAAREKFALPTGPERLVGLNAGAEYGPAKRWPAEHFIAAALAVAAQTPVRWVLLGGANDRDTVSAIERGLREARRPVTNLTGRTSLRELMAVLAGCRALLTNDTGPMHVAAALEVPVVVPFGSTSPELTGPGQPGDGRHRLLRTEAPCAPCFLRQCPVDFRCLKGLAPERVARALMEVLNS